MPLTFSITREDVLRGKIVEPGWYKLLVKNVTQDSASTDGSLLAIVDFTIVEGPFKDTPVRRYFSEKAPGFAIPFLNACGANIGPNGGTFDFERAKGKTIAGYIINEMYQNKPTNKVEDFRALDAPVAAAAETKA